MARATRVIYGKVDTYAWYVSLYAMHNTYDTYVYIHTRALQAWDWLRRLEKRGYVYVCPRVRVSVYVQNAHCNELLWLFPRFSIFFLYFTFFCFLSAVGAHLTYSPASFLFFFFFFLMVNMKKVMRTGCTGQTNSKLEILAFSYEIREIG